MQERAYYVYILTNKGNRVIYIGVCKNLLDRVSKHKNKYFKDSFSDKYNCHRLVYFEIFHDIKAAIKREKVLKKWRRSWKNKLITDFNPAWADLYIILDTPEIDNYLQVDKPMYSKL